MLRPLTNVRVPPLALVDWTRDPLSAFKYGPRKAIRCSSIAVGLPFAAVRPLLLLAHAR